MARPKQERVKSEHMGFRVFPEDRIKIETKAKKAQMQVSEYCRHIAIKGSVKIIESPKVPEVNHDTLTQLRAIAHSINQIAKRVNITGDLDTFHSQYKVTDRETLQAMKSSIENLSGTLGGL